MTSCAYDFNGYCCPSLGLGNTAGAENLEGDVWRALNSVPAETSGEHQNLSMTSWAHDFPSYCWLSLGLGNTADAEILGLESTKICPSRRFSMIVPPPVGPLWGSETQPEPRSWRETSGEH